MVIKFNWKNDNLFQAQSNRVLRYCNLCRNLAKCKIRAKVCVPTRFRCFKILRAREYGEQENLQQGFKRVQSSFYSKRMERFREAFPTRNSRLEVPVSEVKQQRHLHLCGLGCFRRYARRSMQFKAEWTFDSTELK